MNPLTQRPQTEPSALPKPILWFLILIWVCFLARGIFYSSIVPLWEGTDEFSHFAYAQQLAFPGTLPLPDQTPVSREIEESVHLVPMPWGAPSIPAPSVTHDLYWKLLGPDREMLQSQLRSMPRAWARQPSGDKNLFWESLQPPLYYWLASGVLRVTANRSLPGRVVLLRWFSVAIASLVVPLGFLLARCTLRDAGLALAVVALLAAMPELMIVVSRVSNDCLATPLYTLLTLVAFKWLDNPSDTKTALALGAVLGLGLLAKAYFLTTLPALALIFAMALWRSRERRKILWNGTLGALTTILVAGWWYLHNYRSTGRWILQPRGDELRGVSLMRTLGRAGDVDWRNVLRSVQISHIWFGDWSFLQVRGWMYTFFWDIFLVACVGLAVCAWRLMRGIDAYALPSARDFVVLLGFYTLFCIGMAYDALLIFLLFHVSTTDGRYLYCPVVIEIILGIAGLAALLPKAYSRRILPSLTFCFALLELYATHFLLIPYYTGLIAHVPNGGLSTFHVAMLKDTPVSVVIRRLLVNKPIILTAPFLLLIWILFFASTLSLVVISYRVSRAPRTYWSTRDGGDSPPCPQTT